MAAYEILLLNTAIPQIQAAQSGDTYLVPRDIAFSTVANLANGTNLLPSLTFSSDTNTGIYREGADALGFTAGGGTNQMVLTSTGLGIGTSSPTTKLYVTVSAASTACAAFFNTDTANGNGLYVKAGGANSGKYALAVENAAGTSLAYLDSSGNLGIGTSSPAAKLEIAQAADNTDGPKLRIANNGNTLSNGQLIGGIDFFDGDDSGEGVGAYIYSYTTDSIGRAEGQDLRFATGGTTERMRLDSSGNLGLGVTPSAWGNNWTVIDQAAVGSMVATGAGAGDYGPAFNAYNNNTNWLYKYTGGASMRYRLNETGHAWYTAPSGTANTTTITNNVSYTIITSGNQTDFGAANNNVGTVFTANASGTLSSGTVSQNISFTQAMTLDASGNLLVGTTTANAKGYIYQGTAGSDTLWVENGAGNNVFRYKAASGFDNYFDFYAGASSGSLIFRGANTERARITSGGDLLVGTQTTAGIDSGSSSNPGFACGSGTINLQRNNAANMFLSKASGYSSSTYVDFYVAGSSKGSITTDGTNVAYNTSSDYRLKDNPQPLTGSGAFIDALKPKTWDWKSGGKGVGFIAHEVAEVSPGTVVGTKDAVDEEGKPIMQAMEYGSAEFIANIVAELQSLRARVAQLEQGA